MQDSFARARTRPSARDDRVSCIQSDGVRKFPSLYLLVKVLHGDIELEIRSYYIVTSDQYKRKKSSMIKHEIMLNKSKFPLI